MFAKPRSICSRATSRRITVTPRELSHCAMPEPITPAPITAACTIFSGDVRDVPFLYFSARKKLRIRFCVDSRLAKVHNAVQLQTQRFMRRNRQSFIDDFVSTFERRISALFWRAEFLRATASPELVRRFCVFQRSAFDVRDREADRVGQFHLPARVSKLPERNKVCLSKSLRRPLQLRSIAAIACSRPRREEVPSVVSGKPIRVAGSSDATR